MRYISGLKTLAKDFYHYNFSGMNELFSYDDTHEDNIEIFMKDNSFLEIPKVIWMYWDDVSIPPYISLMIDKIRNDNKDHDLVVLNKNNLVSYIEDLKFSSDKYIPIANKSDIIRLELLKRYGGIWIDSSVILTKPISWVHDINKDKKVDLIGYYRDVSTKDRMYPIVESWFLCSQKNNLFINEWLDVLSPLKEMGAKEYFNMIKSRPDYETILQGIHKPDYLLVYLAQQIAMRKINFNLFSKRSESSAFLYQENESWNSSAIARDLCIKKSPITLPPVIKLTNANRCGIEKLIKLKLVKKDSTITAFSLECS